jgi:hypothetical protein
MFRSLGNKLPHTHRSFSNELRDVLMGNKLPHTHRTFGNQLSYVYAYVCVATTGIGGVWGALSGATDAIDENSNDKSNLGAIDKGCRVGYRTVFGGVMGLCEGGMVGFTSPISIPMMCYYAYQKKNDTKNDETY